ncbi:MAG: hypothetical protein ACI8X5_004191 [Planctomycetota bacterium]
MATDRQHAESAPFRLQVLQAREFARLDFHGRVQTEASELGAQLIDDDGTARHRRFWNAVPFNSCTMLGAKCGAALDGEASQKGGKVCDTLSGCITASNSTLTH